MRTDPPTGEEMERLLGSMKRNVLDRAGRERTHAPAGPQLSDRVIGVALAVAVFLGLGTAGAALAISIAPQPSTAPAGAISTTTPGPTPSPTPVSEYAVATATPAPPPIDPLLTVTAIVVRPERLDLEDAAGTVVRELSYDDETVQFVDTLSTVLGAAPVIEEQPAEGEAVVRIYTWPGLVVQDHFRTGHGIPTMNVSVVFELPILGDGVAVVTTAGFAPGDDLAAYAASVGEPYSPEGYGENLVPLEVGPELGPSYHPGYVNAHTVTASDFGSYAGPSIIFAPYNFGAMRNGG